MITLWSSLKKSLRCKSEPSGAHEPKSRKHLTTFFTKRADRFGCSRSISNLRDVFHGGCKRHPNKPPSSSPMSIGSTEFLNPITHEVILSNSTYELRISGAGAGGGGGGGSTFLGTLRPGTPGPGRYPAMHSFDPSLRKSPLGVSDREGGILNSSGCSSSSSSSSMGSCYKCGEQFRTWEAAENHHLSRHAVSELVEGESSRTIVEMICGATSERSNEWGRIEKVLKVHNTQRTVAMFEEYRESVKARASQLAKKHPRCMADGNELLRFYGTTVCCSLGLANKNDASYWSCGLCVWEECGVCRVLRKGFGEGIFTAATGERAVERVEGRGRGRKAVMVCRVIAGRVHRGLENGEDTTGFDSVAGKVGVSSNIEELYLLNPEALLACFIVIFKP